MSAPLPPLAAAGTDAHDQFVISHGKSGGVGVFTADAPLLLRRSQAVLVQTQRGVEIGSVLCPATLRQARILGAISSGPLLRSVTQEDETRREEMAALEQTIFEKGRLWSQRDGLLMEILDVEMLFDGQTAIIQFVGQESQAQPFAEALEQHFGLAIRLENLALPAVVEEASHGCDKPDCGRSADGGGCTSCGTEGGGCSSCGTGKVDMRQYFGHLRDKMEASNRIPLA